MCTPPPSFIIIIIIIIIIITRIALVVVIGSRGVSSRPPWRPEAAAGPKEKALEDPRTAARTATTDTRTAVQGRGSILSGTLGNESYRGTTAGMERTSGAAAREYRTTSRTTRGIFYTKLGC